MINGPLDLVSLLILLWKAKWVDLGPVAPELEDYAATKTSIVGQMLSADDIDPYVWILNPDTFRRWATQG